MIISRHSGLSDGVAARKAIAKPMMYPPDHVGDQGSWRNSREQGIEFDAQ
jgi:hypothetical protein